MFLWHLFGSNCLGRALLGGSFDNIEMKEKINVYGAVEKSCFIADSCTMVINLFTYIVFEDGSIFIPHLFLTKLNFPKRGIHDFFTYQHFIWVVGDFVVTNNEHFGCYNVLLYHQLQNQLVLKHKSGIVVI
mmetsp:Transcript_23355/g.23595  ORF Transcript_23355/g.23595 Transcript_23355/m.23595 type:complete len:131 (+) Transcript_23355:665-1057(+)